MPRLRLAPLSCALTAILAALAAPAHAQSLIELYEAARAYDATQVFAPGERVQVVQVRGATALVWRDDISPSGDLPEAKG